MKRGSDNRALYVDSINKQSILDYTLANKKKFLLISAIALSNERTSHYRPEKVSKKAKNMYAMRFYTNGKNDRIYCQEMSLNGERMIIMAELFIGKKEDDSKLKKRIERLGGYEYEIKS
jgi:hypothetical protein